MTRFEEQLRGELEQLREANLLRRLRRLDCAQGPSISCEGKILANFSSNDYLGFANAPELKEAAMKAVERYGAGSGASRLISGSLAPHHELEEALADFKATPAALSFSTGYAAATGTLAALASREDVLILDKLVHACIIDGARLSGAKLRVFRHNDLNDLERILQWADRKLPPGYKSRRPWIITESVFSMEGDQAPLRSIVELKEKYGAYLMIDEAHATGLYGQNRRGLLEALGLSNRVEVQMGTLGKALGAAGGYITGSVSLVQILVNRARSFIFSTAPVPAAAAAATAGVRLVQSQRGAEAWQRLWSRVETFRDAMPGYDLPQSAILPIQTGPEEAALDAAERLLESGFFVPAIRYPSVPRNKARLRITLTAAHEEADVKRLTETLRQLVSASPGLSPP
jgi:8-amino-7-oxononanoate synthase